MTAIAEKRPEADEELQQLRDEALRRTDLAQLVGRSIELRRRGREHVSRCPFHREKTPSFTVVPHKGFFHCFGCGAHGNAVDWLTDYVGLTYPAAVGNLAIDAGLELTEALHRLCIPKIRRQRQAPVVVQAPDDLLEEQLQSIAAARAMFGEAEGAEGTPVEDYLRHRAIDIERAVGDWPVTVRYQRRLWISAGEYRPAMVCAVQDPWGKVTGVHRTFLRRDGRGHEGKRMAGRCWKGAVRLGREDRALCVGEGIESTLSVPLPPGTARWASLSAGNMLAIILPNHLRLVTLASDADLARIRPQDGKPVWAGPDAALEKRERLLRAGIGAVVTHPAKLGLDFNDMAQRAPQGWLPGMPFRRSANH